MPTKTTRRPAYNQRHQRKRAEFAPYVAAGGVRCARCGELIEPGQPWDMGHVDGDPHRYSGPEHARCNRSTSSRRWEPAPPEPEPERDGVPQRDERWDVPWLKGLRRPPANATWPRYMSVPHRRAVGSLGAEFIRWAERRAGRELRWWQRLVAIRLLEVDARGELVWDTVLFSVARQLGKSWLLRELMLWRIHQSKRFGEPQDVMHTGKDVAICKEVQRPARLWAKAQPGTYKVTEVNGQEQIEYLPESSRWMLRAKESVYGYAVSLAVVDEAWKVRPNVIDDGLTPTMVERVQPQLLLVSTAHRLTTTLMLRRRAAALAQLEDGEGDLLIEWSAPRGAALEDRAAWRMASPHWTPKRERLIAAQLDALLLGEIEDPEEPDPEASFRSQWMNSWPTRLVETPTDWEDLLPPGLWITLGADDLATDGPVMVAVEDDFGKGAAVAAASLLEDGRIEVDGWTCADWDSALADVERLRTVRDVAELHVGASMLDRLPLGTSAHPAIHAHTASALAVFRDLAASGRLAYDRSTVELTRAIGQTQVRESPSGLQIARGPRALIKALVWAVAAQHKPVRVPAIY